MRHVTVRQLRVFVEAAQVLSFARVAERLNLTPAGVSFQIRQVELQCGFELFERSGRKVALTDAGRTLLGYARQILRTLDDADQAMAALKGVSGGHVAIGLVSTAKYIVPHMVSHFQAQYPGVAIELIDGNRRQVLDALGAGAVDLAIMGQPPEGADVVAEAFAPHPSVIVAPPSHPLAALATLAPRELAGEAFVVREVGSGTRGLMDRFFETTGLPPRIAMSSSSNEMIKQAVMAGMGVALISRHTIGLELGLGMIAVLGVEGFPLMRSWFVVHRRSMPLLPVHSRLRAFLIEEGRNIIDRLEQDHARIGTARCASPFPAG